MLLKCCAAGPDDDAEYINSLTTNSIRRDKAFPYKLLLSTSLDHHCYNNNAITRHNLELLHALTERQERESHDLPNATHSEAHGLKPEYFCYMKLLYQDELWRLPRDVSITLKN
ncbi:hypothetical protein GRJ2_000013500 [Grus japonensis]|uniref:Uncharacterized protein n=1 Tax=Grus japonensis TaxID=30415 RepID=A0ABC9VRU8_GRUJA